MKKTIHGAALAALAFIALPAFAEDAAPPQGDKPAQKPEAPAKPAEPGCDMPGMQHGGMMHHEGMGHEGMTHEGMACPHCAECAAAMKDGKPCPHCPDCQKEGKPCARCADCAKAMGDGKACAHGSGCSHMKKEGGSGLTVTPYGVVVLNAFYNNAGVNNLDVPLYASYDPAGGTFSMSIRQSRFGLKFDFPTSAWLSDAKGKGVLEADFFGGYPNGNVGKAFPLPRLRLAFVGLTWKEMGNFTVEVGQDWSVMAPVNPVSIFELAIPEFAATGNLWHRAPQIRLSGEMGGELAFSWAVAAMAPYDGEPSTASAYTFVNGPTAGERASYPAAEARIAGRYKDGERTVAEVGFSGHVGGEHYLIVNNDSRDLTNWAAAVDVQADVKWVQLRGEAFTGENLEFAMGGLQQGVKKVPGPTPTSPPADVLGIRTQGMWGQLSVVPMDWLGVHLGGGIEEPTRDDLAAGMKVRNGRISASVIAKAGKNWKTGVQLTRIVTHGPDRNETWQTNLACQADF